MSIMRLRHAEPQSHGKAAAEGSGTSISKGMDKRPEPTTWAAIALRGSGDALTAAFHAACNKALRSAAPTTTLPMP
jgi:hypothetical protein